MEALRTFQKPCVCSPETVPGGTGGAVRTECGWGLCLVSDQCIVGFDVTPHLGHLSAPLSMPRSGTLSHQDLWSQGFRPFQALSRVLMQRISRTLDSEAFMGRSAWAQARVPPSALISWIFLFLIFWWILRLFLLLCESFGLIVWVSPSYSHWRHFARHCPTGPGLPAHRTPRCGEMGVQAPLSPASF